METLVMIVAMVLLGLIAAPVVMKLSGMPKNTAKALAFIVLPFLLIVGLIGFFMTLGIVSVFS